VKMFPLTPAQASFVQVEIVDRYIDDEDPDIRATAEVVAEHLGRKHGGDLAVPNDLVAGMILDAINGIDDAVEAGRAEHEGYGSAREARGLHRTGTALLKKVRALYDFRK